MRRNLIGLDVDLILARISDLAVVPYAAEDLGTASAGRIAGDRLPRNSGEETAKVWTSV